MPTFHKIPTRVLRRAIGADSCVSGHSTNTQTIKQTINQINHKTDKHTNNQPMQCQTNNLVGIQHVLYFLENVENMLGTINETHKQTIKQAKRTTNNQKNTQTFNQTKDQSSKQSIKHTINQIKQSAKKENKQTRKRNLIL